MKSGRSLFASRIRSPTRRDIRSTSSSSSSRVSAISSGSPTSSSSRWPRSTVSGVLSSCPASSRNCRCPANASSSRSSIPLTVRVSAVMSSLPDTGSRRDRSVSSVISSAVSRSVRSGASNRPDCHAAKPGDQQHRQPGHDAEGPHRVVQPGVGRRPGTSPQPGRPGRCSVRRPVRRPGHRPTGSRTRCRASCCRWCRRAAPPRRRTRGSSSPRPRPVAGSGAAPSHQPTSSSCCAGTLRRM